MNIEKVNSENFFTDSLDMFDRFQAVNSVFVLRDGQLSVVDKHFTEDWSAERKREKASQILSGKYITYCAYDNERAVGEIMLVPELNKNRMIIDSFHVSRDYRRQGIGRALFGAAVKEAESRGASALYISACSSVDTIGFYLAIGCLPSSDPIDALAKDEPCDIQMEYSIKCE